MGKERGEGGVSERLKSELREGERREGGKGETTVRREGRGEFIAHTVWETL